MADHILEMAGRGLIFDFVSYNKIAKTDYLCWMPQTVSKSQRRLWIYQSIHIIPAYLEHHCIYNDDDILSK